MLTFSFNIMDQTTLPPRILIVDDNDAAADIAAELLGLYNYKTAVAYSGTEGLQTAMVFMPDVVLLDLGMPGMDGYQVATALRAMPAFREVALIAFTAWNDPATLARTRSVGFDQHITKPSSLDEILNAIHSASALRGGFHQKTA
ncbi:response regulator [Janthinobacterium sp. HH01]|uniref:response regulator n=1 Tax=Janthinobacterium sp. HH01 TaxID=1198452 RepID=UPI000346848B|nr:response regulator [Janthinobacterium sp. HH01]